MKKKNNFGQKMKKILGTSMLVTAILTAVPMITYGFTGTIYNWSGYVATPGSSVYSGSVSKVTSSSVMVQYSAGSSEFVGASVLASLNESGSYSDVTLYTTAHPNYNVYKNSSSYVEVLNLAYETYGQCYVKTRYVTTTAGNHAGRWAADVS